MDDHWREGTVMDGGLQEVWSGQECRGLPWAREEGQKQGLKVRGWGMQIHTLL